MLTINTKSKALNVFADNEVDYGRISVGKTLASDLDFKFKEGDGFVTVTRLAHYHLGSRYVLGDQLSGMVTATAAEATRAQAAESKIASDLSAEAKRASDAEAKVSSDLTAEVARAGVAEGLIMTAVAEEAIARQNATTAATTALALERAARESADSYLDGRITGDVTRIDGQLVYLDSRANNSVQALGELRTELQDNIIVGNYASTNQQIADISQQQIPNLGSRIDNETARAIQIENELQQQITSLLANTDATALNSLAELVADYSANGSGVNTALQAALARIDQLEQTVAALQNTGGGCGSGTPPVEN